LFYPDRATRTLYSIPSSPLRAREMRTDTRISGGRFRLKTTPSNFSTSDAGPLLQPALHPFAVPPLFLTKQYLSQPCASELVRSRSISRYTFFSCPLSPRISFDLNHFHCWEKFGVVTFVCVGTHAMFSVTPLGHSAMLECLEDT